MTALRTYRFGVIGTGRMAATMMECFALSSRANVVAVASDDIDRSRSFAARFNIGAAHGRTLDLLARDDIDAVYIANATNHHAAITIAALAAGKAVLCEKPFAISVEQGLEVSAAATAHRRLFMEAQWTPFLPLVAELRRLVTNRELGAPLHLFSDFGQTLQEASHRRLFGGEGAGVLLDFGVYPIVLALQLLGPVESVQASVIYNQEDVDIQASLQLVHAQGGQSQLAASLVSAMPNTSALSGSHGLALFDSPVVGAESLQVRHVSPTGASAESGNGIKSRVVAALRQRGWVRRLKAMRPVGRGGDHSFGSNRYLPQLLHFLALLDADALQSDLMPLQTSLDVLRIIDKARLASPPPGRIAPL